MTKKLDLQSAEAQKIMDQYSMPRWKRMLYKMKVRATIFWIRLTH